MTTETTNQGASKTGARDQGDAMATFGSYLSPNSYALASGLIGFRSSVLRVQVTEHRDGVVWVVTADLLDAGTRLVLDEVQVVPEPEPVSDAALRHHSGLVSLSEAN